MTPGEDEGVVRGLSRFLGGLFVDELGNGAVLFSLIVIVAAAITQDPPVVLLGATVGLAGIVVTWGGMRRRWSDSTMAIVVLTVLVADAATLWLIWGGA